jgi:cytochrome P450
MHLTSSAMAVDLSQPLGLAAGSALLGVISHLTYFIHGEHHSEAPAIALLGVVTPVSIFATFLILAEAAPVQAAWSTAVVCGSYVSALWASMIIYRVFFHRLRNFPGPPLAKVSKLYHLVQLVQNKSHNHYLVTEWHQQYGPFVRTGPEELSIAHPAGPMAIQGPNSKCIKSSWYDGGKPRKSLHSVRDPAEHSWRRKVWEPGFSIKSLRNYERRILKYGAKLIEQISSFGGQPINATQWVSFFGFDLMGDLAFGRPFDMLESGKMHHILKIVNEGQAYLGILGTCPWIFPILIRVPGLVKPFQKWVQWSEAQVEARKKMEVPEPDIMHWLLEASSTIPKEEDMNWLSGDSRLIIVAGSDTSSTTVTNVLYYLGRDLTCQDKLRAELKQLIQNVDELNSTQVRDAPYLNGCINEALRLRPPVPSAIYRVTPPEGITIAGTFIPGGVTVSAPQWTIGRMGSVYPRALEFIPERWSPAREKEFLPMKDAFAPFSLGQWGCIGKQLAYQEMRCVLALLVLSFRWRFADGEDGRGFEVGTVDKFTLEVGELRVVFERL